MENNPTDQASSFQRSKSTVELSDLDLTQKPLLNAFHRKQISYSGDKELLPNKFLNQSEPVNNLEPSANENSSQNASKDEHPLKFHHRRATSLASSEMFSNKYKPTHKDYEPSQASTSHHRVENQIFRRWLRRGTDGSLELSPKTQRKLIKFFVYILMIIFIGILAVFSINWTFAFCVLPLSTFRECRVTSLDGGAQALCSSLERTPTLQVEWCKDHHDLSTCNMPHDQTCTGFVNVFSSPKSLQLYESFECTVQKTCHTIPTHLDHVNPSPNWYYFSFFLVVFITCAFCFCLLLEAAIVLAYICLSRKDYTISYIRDDQQVI